eukprot:551998_1
MSSSWSNSLEERCYHLGLETPYWIIVIGFMSSLFINSFILFSGQSLTSQLWYKFKSTFFNCCGLNCSCFGNSSNKQSNIHYPSLIKITIQKNVHGEEIKDYDSDIEFSSDSEEGSRNETTIDLSVRQTLLQDIEKEAGLSNEDNDVLNHDVSLSTGEISGYYKLVHDKHNLYDISPIYRSAHRALSCDRLLLHYMGNKHDIHGDVGWVLSYDSFYGFRNELFQQIEEIKMQPDINHQIKKMSINSNYVDMNDVNVNSDKDCIQFERLRLRGAANVWKLCYLHSYRHSNALQSEIICYDLDDNILSIDETTGDVIKNSFKLKLKDFSLITNGFMDINVNGNYFLRQDRKRQTIHIDETKDNFDESVDSNKYTKIEINDKIKSRKHITPTSRSHSHHSHHSLSSVLSYSMGRMQHSLMKHKKIIAFQHENNEDVQLIICNKMKHKCLHKTGCNDCNVPAAVIFHNKLRQFIAYIPQDKADDECLDSVRNMLDGNNWRMIEWGWKTINNLKISTSNDVVFQFFLAQFLSVWFTMIAVYQWYEDIQAFIRYYHKYHDTDSLWQQYECFAFITTNTPNMKQLVLLVGLAIWAMKIAGKLNYAVYLSKQRCQKILFLGYSLLLLLFIPILFTHYLPMFCSMFLTGFIVLFIIHRIGSYCCPNVIAKRKAGIREKRDGVRNTVKQISDVTIVKTESSYSSTMHAMVVFNLWKLSICYGIMILCVPVMSKVYSGTHFPDAFGQTLTSRQTDIYFQNVEHEYATNLNKLRVLLYWLM